eukprot:1173816-Amphidinium_carterae.1
MDEIRAMLTGRGSRCIFCCERGFLACSQARWSAAGAAEVHSIVSKTCGAASMTAQLGERL